MGVYILVEVSFYIEKGKKILKLLGLKSILQLPCDLSVLYSTSRSGAVCYCPKPRTKPIILNVA